VIVPFFNEEHTIQELHARLVAVMDGLGRPYEIIFVDDSSRDATFEHMRSLKPLRAFRLGRNRGQTKAFALGVAKARGEIIVSLDGDLENFPEDIPALIRKLDEGYDIVSGWRRARWRGQFFRRKIPSLLANRLISWISGFRIHDHGCFLRAYRKTALSSFDFHGEVQRMIIPYAAHNGASIAEVEVRYAPRAHGVSHYGLSRIFEVMIDMLSLHFFHRFGSRPRHFFGRIGFISFFFSLTAAIYMLYLKIFEGKSFIITPMPLVVALFALVGVIFVLMGILAEMIVRRENKATPMEFDIREEIDATAP